MRPVSTCSDTWSSASFGFFTFRRRPSRRWRPASWRAWRPPHRCGAQGLPPSSWRAGPVHSIGQVLGEILHLELRLGAFGGNPIAEHREAEGTGGRHAGRLRAKSLLDAVVVDAGPDLLLHPHAAAARATTEAALMMALDLDQLRARDRLDDRAWRVIDVVPAA